jgi:undecaprenyl-diphosphatase
VGRCQTDATPLAVDAIDALGSAGQWRGSRLAAAPATVATMSTPAQEQKRSRNEPLPASDEAFLAHPAHALWAAGGMFAIVVLIAILVPAGPLELDRSWSEAMRHLETPMLTHLALVFNWLGRGLGRAVALALIGLLLLRRRRWLALAAFAVAESLTPLLSTLLKALVDRARPPDGLVHPVGASFPSGHAAYAGATCVALVLLFTTPGTRRRWWWALASLGVVGMAWSRTYLQVHWLTDVIAGALLGSGISLLVFAVAQQYVQAVTGSNLNARTLEGCKEPARRRFCVQGSRREVRTATPSPNQPAVIDP